MSRDLKLRTADMPDSLKRTGWCFKLLMFMGLLCLPGAPAFAQNLAIVGVKVYPAPDAPAILDATVVVRGGVIADVGPSTQNEFDPSYRIIPGKGTGTACQSSLIHATRKVWTSRLKAVSTF